MLTTTFIESHRRLGFRPAFLDTRNMSIYVTRSDDVVPASDKLIAGFVRNGFFFTRSAAARAVAEWSLTPHRAGGQRAP